MISQEKIRSLYGLDVIDGDGDKIGSIGAVWTDAAGQPSWASVRTGLFGINESLFPLHDADLRGDRVIVPFDKSTVKEAPNVDADADEPLTQAETDRLYEYYGIAWDDSYLAQQATDRQYSGRQAEGRHREDAMTRSEERLDVGTERERTGRAQLRKYVVTEQEQVSVPVQREEVRLDRTPITEANRDAAYSGADLTESEHEVTLHAERPVVRTETVPVEQVRLGKQTVTEQEQVAGTVRKERIEADLPGEEGRRTIS